MGHTRAWLILALIVAPVLCGTVSAQDSVPAGSEGMNAVLWMQKSHEYAYVSEQIYRTATARLQDVKIRGNALIPSERTARPKNKQPAIILDLDETVLDNSPFQGAVVKRDRFYRGPLWNEWLKTESATLVPGAKAFLLEAKRAGFQIFYVTNRECDKNKATASYPHPECDARKHTLENLRALGLPFADDPKALLLRNDQQGWDDKSSRRRFIGAQHRVAMLIGDDLGDFLPVPDERALHDSVGATQRVTQDDIVGASTYQLHRGRFGVDWFLLPNPTYGSWERALGLRPACSEATPKITDENACYSATLARKQAQVVAADLTAPPTTGDAGELKLAAWNTEWLMTPETYDTLTANCVTGQPPSNVRAIPCPEAGRPPVPRHTMEDFAALKSYAVKLNADVIALSEVDGPETAQLVFDAGYKVDCFVSRAHPQKTGFAIRSTIPYRCNGDYSALDIDGSSRSGADVTIFPGTPNEVRLLAVHLKSGCPQQRLDNTTNSACARLREQVPVLEQWMDARVTEGVAFALMGDFNRRLEFDARFGAGPDESQPLNVFAALSDNEPAGAVLSRATEGQAFIGCSSRDNFQDYIDNVLFGKSLASRSANRTFVRVTYTDADIGRFTLSDHCPVGVVLKNAVQ